jgi:hypothetical protein
MTQTLYAHMNEIKIKKKKGEAAAVDTAQIPGAVIEGQRRPSTE